ncbi:MAG: PAS domain S-box protein [Armatimonadota bacterium]
MALTPLTSPVESPEGDSFRLLFNAHPEPMWVYDLETLRFLAVNDAAVDSYGYSRDEFLRMTILEIRPESEHSRLLADVARERESHSRSGIWLHRTRTGRVFDAEITSRPLTFRGRPAALLVARDASDQRRMERELEQVVSGALCLLFHAEVQETDRGLVWEFSVTDEEAAERVLPVQREPGQSYFQAWYASWDEEDRRRMDEQARTAIRAGQSYHQEFRCRRRDGAWRWLSQDVHVEPVGPRRWRAVGVCTDITPRKEMEEQLRQSEARFRAMFQQAGVGIALIDLDGRYLLANPRFCRILGYSREELHGMRFQELTHPEHLEDDVEALRRLKAGEIRTYSTEKRYLRKDGREVWANVSIALIYGEGGRPSYLNAVVEDITERKLAQEQLRRLTLELETRVRERTAELQAVNQELEAFCYSVSHDLRTPLRSIEGFSRAILEDFEDQLDELGQDHLRRVMAASHRMSELIDDLLSLSRVTRAEMRRETVSLSQVARDVLADLQRAEPDRRAELVVAPDVTAVGDPRLLRVVLENLLGNAWKFTSRREEARIEFGSLSGAGGERVYFVRDNGAGFDMAYADKLFSPFQRLHSPKEFTGSGIGLATVQRVITRHGGRVWAEGSVGEGAEFYFTLAAGTAGFAPG